MIYTAMRAAVLLGTALIVPAALAARIQSSTLVVQVLSVDQEFSHRYGAGPDSLNGFVARAQIQSVIQTDHGLAQGETITFHYTIQNPQPDLPWLHKPLRPGERKTLSLLKREDGYFWR